MHRLLLFLAALLSLARAACPPAATLPVQTGCDGVLLTASEAIAAQSSGITTIDGPGDRGGVSIDDGQFIDLHDTGCYQLGAAGADFSLSMWLKVQAVPSQGGKVTAQIIGTKSQYAQGPQAQGFLLYAKESTAGKLVLGFKTTASVGGNVDLHPGSADFEAEKWSHVVVRYRNGGDSTVSSSTVEVIVNMVSKSGAAYGNVHNSDLRVGDEGWGTISPFMVDTLESFSRLLTDDEVAGLYTSGALAAGLSLHRLSDATQSLRDHLAGTSVLSAAGIADAAASFLSDASLLGGLADEALLTQVLDLVDEYELSTGGLFMSTETQNGFPRQGAVGDGRDLDRAMISIQQAMLDSMFSAKMVAGCGARLFLGRRWATAAHFPGTVGPSADPQQQHAASIEADVPVLWGQPVAFSTDPQRKPTGWYLPPGSIGNITVPQEVVDLKGFSVLIGAHTTDNSNKDTHKRLDRVTLEFPITSTITTVFSPLGGGVYINVPHLAGLGLISLSLSGVVAAPFFSLQRSRNTTADEWSWSSQAPAPWADFESNRFLMQVPRTWVYAKSFPELTTLLEDYDKAMEGVMELLGREPAELHRHVLYIQPDLQIKHGAYGIGYPQVNNLISWSHLRQPSDLYGDHSHWMVTDAVGWEVAYHELGHAVVHSMFRGETESIVNFPHCYVRAVKFGVDLDTAFKQSFGPAYGHVGFSPDDAAIHWMLTENFRNGNEMDHSNTEFDEFRYQQRGYAKYADIARTFGWEALRHFHRQEHIDFASTTAGIGDGLADVDSRILRMSVGAGYDLTPLIHFWGIFPVDADALSEHVALQGLESSLALRDLLERYASIVPADNIEFNEHFERVYPGRPTGGNPLYGHGWYNTMRDVWNENHASQARERIYTLIKQYWPVHSPAPTSSPPAPTSSPALCTDTKPARTCNRWKRQGKCNSNANAQKKCKKTCGLCCTDRKPAKKCEKWKRRGKCTSSASVRRKCQRTCELCVLV